MHVELTPEGASRFEQATERLQGRRVAVLIDGEVLNAPVIQSKIVGGIVNISVGGSDPSRELEKTRELAARLRAARPR